MGKVGKDSRIKLKTVLFFQIVAVKNKERERRPATASRSREQSAQCAKLKEEVSR